jgi:hypothetical protein
MTCHVLPGGIIACGRGPRPRLPACASCDAAQARLLCDGCDGPLCAACAVAPREDEDFCPACARCVFRLWLARGGSAIYLAEGQAAGRAAFRVWAREHPTAFALLRGARRAPRRRRQASTV